MSPLLGASRKYMCMSWWMQLKYPRGENKARCHSEQSPSMRLPLGNTRAVGMNLTYRTQAPRVLHSTVHHYCTCALICCVTLREHFKRSISKHHEQGNSVTSAAMETNHADGTITIHSIDVHVHVHVCMYPIPTMIQDLLPSNSGILHKRKSCFDSFLLCESIAFNHKLLHKSSIF